MDTILVASQLLNGDLTNAYIGITLLPLQKNIYTTSIMKFLPIACDNCYILHLK